MSSYKATVIKTGNSYALRVPKAYADKNKFKLGEKVELPDVKRPPRKQDRTKIQKLFKELQKSTATASPGGLAGIKDPIAWQREIRKDRPLPGRD